MGIRPPRLVWVIAFGVLALIAAEGTAQAQAAPDRGFTALVNVGFGIQHDSTFDNTSNGLAGLNVGVGAFLTDQLAVMFRISGTNVTHDLGLFEIDQISGTVGGTVQYWASDRVYVEAGAGAGFWKIEDDSDRGLGLILGAGVSVFSRGHNSLQVGFEYAPAFTDPDPVHNIGITFGYQFR